MLFHILTTFFNVYNCLIRRMIVWLSMCRHFLICCIKNCIARVSNLSNTFPCYFILGFVFRLDSIHKSVKAKFSPTSYSSDDFHFYWMCLNIISMNICSVYLLYIVRDDLHYIYEIEQRVLLQRLHICSLQ